MMDAVAARCGGGLVSDAPPLNCDCAECFATMLIRKELAKCHPIATAATPALAGAAASALAAAQASAPDARSDLGHVARQSGLLLGVCVNRSPHKLLAARCAMAVPGVLPAMVWCCALPLGAKDVAECLLALKSLAAVGEGRALRVFRARGGTRPSPAAPLGPPAPRPPPQQSTPGPGPS